jgi:hypothetical protein
MFGRVSFGHGSFSRMSFGCLVIWTRGNLVARSYGRRLICSQDHLVASIWARVLGRGSFSRMSFGRRVIWSRVIWPR